MLSAESEISGAIKTLDSKRVCATERRVRLALLVTLAIYFGLHVVTRTLVSENLQLDEAEQFIVTQDWRWGYGSQPPLYDWLQHVLFHTVGENVFALSLLKNLLLWSAYAFTFFAAREILGNVQRAALATVALLFIPQIAWESQRDQSHLVLAMACAAATLWIWARLLKTRNTLYYALFGAAVGLGVLSKYNYVVLPVALVAAALMATESRPAMFNRRMILALCVFLAVAGPHLAWMIGHKPEVAAQSAVFITKGSGQAVVGEFRLLKAIIAMAGIPLLMFSPFLLRRERATQLVRILARAIVIGLVLVSVVILISGVTYIRDRWLQPLLFALPIVLIGFAGSRLEGRQIRRYMTFAVVVALSVLGAINFTVIGANALNRPHNLHVPYRTLAAELRHAGFERGSIVANGFFLGGNLKKQFHESHVIVPELHDSLPPTRPTLVIWNAREAEKPDRFLEFASSVSGADTHAFSPTYLDIPCRNGRRSSERYGFILIR